MHHLPFSFKRAHRATLKLLHPIAKRNGLTPARFDVLWAVQSRRSLVEPFQSRIAQLLGLCRSTICKMVKAMEACGLVEKSRDMLLDQRYRRITITRYGRWCIRRVLKAIRRGEVKKPLLQSVSFWNCKTHNERLDFTVDLQHNVGRLLVGLRDRRFLPNLYRVPMHIVFQRSAARNRALAAAAPASVDELADVVAENFAEAVD